MPGDGFVECVGYDSYLSPPTGTKKLGQGSEQVNNQESDTSHGAGG
jgi:hypothetical protein